MLNTNIDLNGSTILVTGAAGFIGSNLVKLLLRDYPTAKVVGIDNMNDYYDVRLKEQRLQEIEQISRPHGESRRGAWTFVRGNIADRDLINTLFAEHQFDVVVSLAAQAGVRYSITNPDAYIESNLIGFYNILEACRHSKELVEEYSKTQNSIHSSTLNNESALNSKLSTLNYDGVRHLVYASSSSV